MLLRAGLVTLVIILLGNGASTIAVGRNLLDRDSLDFLNPGVLAMHFVFTGCHHSFLRSRETAATDVDRRGCDHVVFLGLLHLAVRQVYFADFTGGANIGLGLVMMAAPVLACLMLVVVGQALRWVQR